MQYFLNQNDYNYNFKKKVCEMPDGFYYYLIDSRLVQNAMNVVVVWRKFCNYLNKLNEIFLKSYVFVRVQKKRKFPMFYKFITLIRISKNRRYYNTLFLLAYTPRRLWIIGVFMIFFLYVQYERKAVRYHFFPSLRSGKI